MSVLSLLDGAADTGQMNGFIAMPPDPPPTWPALLVVLALILILAWKLHRRDASLNKWEWRIPDSWRRAAPILGFHLLISWPFALALLIVWLER